MAKGNTVIVRYKSGDGVLTDTITADRGGRTIDVEVTTDSGTKWLAATVMTRGGSAVTKSTYRLDEIVSYTVTRKERGE